MNIEVDICDINGDAGGKITLSTPRSEECVQLNVSWRDEGFGTLYLNDYEVECLIAALKASRRKPTGAPALPLD